MRRILTELLKQTNKVRKDYRGMTFVEVICAVAIFALVSTTIGGIIVMSVRTYQKGVSETAVQQEAQTAVNNISNMIKDACSIQYGESGSQVMIDGTEPVLNDDGTPKIQAVGKTELAIITNKQVQHTIVYDESNKLLLYGEADLNDPSAVVPTQLMAKNITEFCADTTDFKENRTIKLNMTVLDESTGKSIPLSYTMTSRNEVAENMTFVSTSDDPVIIFLEPNLNMVPGETYKIPIAVVGKLTVGLEGSSTNANVGAVTTDYVEATVPRDTTADTAMIQIQTKDKKSDGSPKASNSTNIYIRRVTSINVTHAVNRSQTTDGTYESAGAEYIFYANVTGSNLTKSPGSSWDIGYKKAQAVYWSYELSAGGNVYTCTSDDTGIQYSDQAGMERYVKLKESKEDIDRPSLTLTIMQNMPADFMLTVTAVSKHALGENKGYDMEYDRSGCRYPDMTTVISGDDVVTPRETRVDKSLEITLEPNETGAVALSMKGGMTSDVSFTYKDRSDPTTRAEYKASDDKVYITLGKDEKGTGNTAEAGKQKYTFTVGVNVKGVEKSTITVHVCRIDVLSIEVVDNFEDKSDNLMGLPTYDFRARINVANGKNDENMRSAIQYLITDTSAVPNTLATKITWELVSRGASGKTIHKDSVICIAGVGASDKGTVIGSYTKSKKGYYEVVNIKPARIEQNPDGTWYLKQVPEIDISPQADTDTGLPADVELKVTMEALHPLGKVDGVSYNKTGVPYGTAEADAYISGSQTLETPTKIVVVEPGQGSNDPNPSEDEMVIPIEVRGGAVYKMKAEISGNSSKNTKLAVYAEKDNPYLGSSAAGSSARAWYLGMIIGTDEKGKNNTGLIDVKITAYGSNGQKVATTDFQLAVRRVKEVKVKVENDERITTVNEAGRVVMLEAYPLGYGADGVEYFDEQKDEKGNVCRWEKEGYGKYQSPLTMEWTMLYNGQEKPLEQWTEYFESGTIVSETDAENYKNTVQFKLKKSLPDGAEFHATSLHALGTVDNVRYNKSGKEYGEVYGSLRVGDGPIIDPDDPVDDNDIDFLDNIARGQDFDRFNDNHELDNLIAAGADQNNAKWFMRVREILDVKEDGTIVCGEWSTYRRLMENSTYKKLNAMETRSFLPDKRYQVEMALMVIDKDNKKLIWPYDSSLTAPGSGTGFEGYANAWSANKAATPKADYTTTFNLGRACYYFKVGNQTYRSYGSVENPVVLHPGQNFQIDLGGYTIEQSHFQHMSQARVQKLSGNTWQLVGNEICENIQDKSSFLLLKNINSTAKGIYRISFQVHVTDQDVTEWNGSIWNPSYSTTDALKNTDYLVCGSNGTAGYLYIKIE